MARQNSCNPMLNQFFLSQNVYFGPLRKRSSDFSDVAHREQVLAQSQSWDHSLPKLISSDNF